MDKLLLIEIFLPLAAGFVMLFLPNKMRGLSKVVTLVICLAAFYVSVQIFTSGPLRYAAAIFQLDNLKLDLLLRATPLSGFILIFAMGFGVMITLYSLKKDASNIYFGSILLTIGG